MPLHGLYNRTSHAFAEGTPVIAIAFRWAVLCAALPALAATFAGVEVPAPPPPRDTTETYWGVTVQDPYRFLEDTANPEVQKYMRAEADAAQAILDKIPGRDKLLKRIQEIDADSPAQIGTIRRDNRGRLFYLRREPKDNQFKLYRRDRPDGDDVLLVDPEVLMKKTGKPYAIAEFAPSFDGKLLAYSISASGSEIGTLNVIDTATLKEVTPAIDRIRGGDPSWLEDGSGFFYSRLKENYEMLPRAERFLDNLTYLRRLAEPDKDVAVFGPGLHPEVSIERFAGGSLAPIPGQPLIAAVVAHGVDRNRSLYISAAADVLAGKPKWRKVFDKSDRIESASAGGGYLYLKTSKDAPRYKLTRIAFPALDLAKAESVIAPSENVVVDVGAAKEALYVTRREGAVKRLYRLGYDGKSEPQRIALPIEGTVDIEDADVRLEGAVLSVGGWTRTVTPYVIGARDAAPSDLKLALPGKFDAPEGILAREVKVKSHDGVEVPLSIVSRADIKLDGHNPTMLYGYAAYGLVDEPSWSPRLLAWLEQGGVLAVVHARGGGIYGDEWRRAGWKTTKPNTWKDGIAAGEWLVANGYATRDRLSIYGGSAGGIFVGRAFTERPDLFGSAAMLVGNTDSVRSETRANGVANIPEYGTVKDEQEFKALLVMSTYNNIKADTKYPAVIFEHGVNDTRVDVWMTLKTGSRLAAATTSGKPVLMRLDYDAGHGIGSTREQAQRRTADRWAFFLWQAGVPGFQPK
jgi:prolyl oligopeptidase